MENKDKYKKGPKTLQEKEALLLVKEVELSRKIRECGNGEDKESLKRTLKKTLKSRAKVQKQIDGEEVSDSGSSSDSNSSESDSMSSQQNLIQPNDNGTKGDQNACSTKEEQEGREPSLEKMLKKYKHRFDISHPTKAEADELIGLKTAKLFVKAVIKGPTEFPAHASRMRAKSKLKAILLHGPPGKMTWKYF